MTVEIESPDPKPELAGYIVSVLACSTTLPIAGELYKQQNGGFYDYLDGHPTEVTTHAHKTTVTNVVLRTQGVIEGVLPCGMGGGVASGQGVPLRQGEALFGEHLCQQERHRRPHDHP